MIAASPYHCTSQPNIRIANRQAKNRKREQTPERKAAVKAWCVGKTCTCGCGQPANCAHHPSDDLYEDEWADLSQCEPWNSRCHHLHHKGFVRCPECGGWMRAGREKCAKCAGWTGKKEHFNRHSCDRHGAGQICSRSSYRCPYARTKAEKMCDIFEAKKKAMKK